MDWGKAKKRLTADILHAQYRKSVGLLYINQAEKFVDLIHEIENTVSTFDTNALSIRDARLQPKTSENKYWSTRQKYRGPITIAKYEKGEFRVIRCESDFAYMSLHEPGIIIYLRTDRKGRIGNVLDALREKISWPHLRVEEIDDGGIIFCIFVPIGHLINQE